MMQSLPEAAPAVRRPRPETPRSMNEQAVSRIMIRRPEVAIEVLAQGHGPRIVLLPSLGRGAADFDPIAERLAPARFRVLRPQPRGIRASPRPTNGIVLHAQ